MPTLKKGFALIPLLAIASALIVITGLLSWRYFFGLFEPLPPVTIYQLPAPTPVTVSTVNPTTKNWKTYTNENLKFSFKYPSNWKLINGYKDEIRSDDFEQDEKKILDEIIHVGADMIIPKEKEDGLNSFTQMKEGITVDTLDVQTPKTLFNFKKINLNGQEAIIYEYQGTKSLSTKGQRVEFMRKNGDIYMLSFRFASADSKETFDQILSTFQFLD